LSSTEAITDWIGRLKAGDRTAAQQLWECYFDRLVRLARQMLQGAPRRAADEEDVALSVLDSFCRGAERGRLPGVDDRNNLWRFLVVLTARKSLDQVQQERRLKRGGNRVKGEAVLAGAGAGGFEWVASQEPTPEFVALMADECRRLLERLEDPQLQTIAVWKMEGYTNDEIAGMLRCSLRRVERKLQLIRAVWKKAAP
jgi:DNA-directed RNA polymerase specialized sigma24 family protein